jgi:hypothetical protein
MSTWQEAEFWDEEPGELRLQWPIHVGVLARPEPEHALWVARLADSPFAGSLYDLDELGAGSRGCTLLVVAGPLQQALGEIAGAPPLRAELVLLVTAEAPPGRDELHRLARAVRARATVAVHGSDPADRLISLVVGLAHDEPLADVLSRMNARVLGSRDALTGVRIRRWAEGLVARARTLRDATVLSGLPLALPPELAGRLNLPTLSHPDHVVASLTHRLEHGSFVGETHEATTAALAARTLDDLERGVRDREREVLADRLKTFGLAAGRVAARHLLARACDENGDRITRLVPDVDFHVEVRIAVPQDGWLGLDAPLPALSAPPTAGEWSLRVILWDPTYTEQPLVASLPLPELGPSRVVRFALRGRPGGEPLACRITVLDDNEVLQTGVLRIPGVPSLLDAAESFTVDAAPRPFLDRTGAQRWFDGAIVLNHDDGGQARALMFGDGAVAVVPLGQASLDTFVTLADRCLSAIKNNPERYAGLRAEGTVMMLRELASAGAVLHAELFDQGLLDRERFAGDGPLQVVAALADGFLPVEFLYRWDAPDADADLCVHAEVALRDGVCPGKCSGESDRICPLGFWGLSRVLERHANRRDTPSGIPFVLYGSELKQRANTLQPLARALVGASDLVGKFDATAVTSLIDAMTPLVRGLWRADDWDRWAVEAQLKSPSLLVVLPHHLTKASEDFLQIGAASDLSSRRVRQHHLGPEGARPLVLLIGCETQFGRIQFDTFVRAFLRRGAAAVVATVSTILGRHAAPATARLVREIHERTRTGPIRLGDAILAARRALLAEGMTMSLGLTAYGDADCLLEAAPAV